MSAAYIINKTLTSSLDGKATEEVWIGKLVDYTPLRTFGCTAYTHQSVEKM